jgi:phenylpropionate dioxygenase-like ring-hydroxylating dioxygenase large terminal subunit
VNNLPEVFNSAEVLVEGWYWLCKSTELKRGKTKHANVLGKQLALFRTESGQPVALDAYCPHMGAHLAEGKVCGESIRCAFHGWAFNKNGECADVPCLNQVPKTEALNSWPVTEHYGLIWVYAGKVAHATPPVVPELDGCQVDYWVGAKFRKECHPTVMMVNAIDEQHFKAVHPMAGGLASDLRFRVTPLNRQCIEFDNINPAPPTHWFSRLVSRFYKDALTYKMSYWFASSGTVTLGPDFLHFHIVFAIRPTSDGKSDGIPIFVTKKRSGVLGKLLNMVLLAMTRVVSGYFAHGDTKIFKTIRFHLRTPIRNDAAIVHFIKHTEGQMLSSWGKRKLTHKVEGSSAVPVESWSNLLKAHPVKSTTRPLEIPS